MLQQEYWLSLNCHTLKPSIFLLYIYSLFITAEALAKAVSLSTEIRNTNILRNYFLMKNPLSIMNLRLQTRIINHKNRKEVIANVIYKSEKSK